tara:strand:- start:89716 stop:90201 length:486 start_codon:yes stop_codon:yes gene_type:complete
VLLFFVAGCSEEQVLPVKADVAAPSTMEVFKQPTCGCCGEWVDHVRSAGFEMDVKDRADLNSIKSSFGIAPQYQSCHTAVTQDYVFEGHVPASQIQRFLSEKPADAIGLAVPGMPIGSPGMEMGDRFEAYDVLLLKNDGTHEVYARVEGPDTIIPAYEVSN